MGHYISRFHGFIYDKGKGINNFVYCIQICIVLASTWVEPPIMGGRGPSQTRTRVRVPTEWKLPGLPLNTLHQWKEAQKLDHRLSVLLYCQCIAKTSTAHFDVGQPPSRVPRTALISPSNIMKPFRYGSSTICEIFNACSALSTTSCK